MCLQKNTLPVSSLLNRRPLGISRSIRLCLLFDKALQKQTTMQSKSKGPSINYVVWVEGGGGGGGGEGVKNL